MNGIAITLSIIGLALVLFAWNPVPAVIVAIGASLALYFTGVLTMPEALTGFGDPVVVLIAALLLLKSQLMMPSEEVELPELAPGEAAEELLARMLEYSRYRSAAEFMHQRLAAESGFRYRSAPLPKELHERFEFIRLATCVIQSPFPAWLTLQGVKTLPLRMARHSDNALRVARFLEAHPRVRSLAYPWLESSPYYELARRQQLSGGAIISFEVDGGTEAGIRLMNSFRLCTLAENLGAAETLVTHPVSMTHGSVPAEMRKHLGITPGLVRISVGIEDLEDLIADLENAFDGI